MTPGEQWTALVNAMVEESAADADQAVQFVSTALQVKRKMFAFLARDRLVVKLPAARVQTLIEAGDGQPYDAGTGRPQREYVAIASSAGESWLPMAREAKAFVASKR